MRLHILIDGVQATGTLEDNESAREFASLLPLSLTLRDYASTEKIADLPRRLSEKGAPPAGTAGAAGEIAYFPPWGNLAVFYRDFEYSHGLVRLGKIDAGTDVLSRPGAVEVTFERFGNDHRE